MRRRCALLSTLALLLAVPALAQTAAPPVDEPPLRRWLDIQAFTLYTRYRVVESSAEVVTSNHAQYKDTLRVRVNLDARRRFAVQLGAFSGSSFISTWNNTGIGTGTGDLHDHYVKQLFASAEALPGLELQVGGLYVARGESTEYTSYDEDGYVVGERATLRRPGAAYFDEVTVTRGLIGPFNTPSLWARRDGLRHPNYTQLLAVKRFSSFVAGSFDYSTQSGADTLRAAVALRFPPGTPVSALRFEQYHRTASQAASGFALTAERPIARARLQGGYATVDEFYGGWNADRIQRGRRFFAVLAAPLAGPLGLQLFATRALASPYAIANRTRFDAILTYDLQRVLRQTGVF